MPVECKFPVKQLDQDSFHTIDKVVMGHAFDIHNELGRFCDERIYQDELAYRCTESGIEILREAIIHVTHLDFCKPYYLDVVANTGAIYELKAVKGLSGNHEAQLINYLLLAGLNHGKLVNMRPTSVEYRYVSTQLTSETRRKYLLDMSGWPVADPVADVLHGLVMGLLDDWGAFLDIQLYREALIHFLGGEEQVVQSIDIHVGGRKIGRQKICLIAEQVAVHLSAIKMHHATYQKHLARLLEHSTLRQIHWINFQGAQIQFKMLEKK